MGILREKIDSLLPKGRAARTAIQLIALTLSLFLLATAAFDLTREGGRIAAIRPVDAVVLALVLSVEKKRWIGFLAALQVALLAAHLVVGDSLLIAVWLSASSFIEVLVVAGLFHFGRKPRLISQIGILKLCGSALVGCLVSTSLATAGLALSGAQVALSDAALWFAADMLGIILFTPLLKILIEKSSRRRGIPFDLKQVFAFVGVCLVAFVVFAQSDFPFLFFVPPALVWLAFVGGIRGAAVGLLGIAAIAIPFALADQGPTSLMQASMEAKILVLQSFLVVNSILALAVGVSVTDRRRLLAYLERSQNRLKSKTRRLDEMLGKSRLAEQMSGVGHWSLNPKTGAVYWSPHVYEIHGVAAEEFDPAYDDAVAFYPPEERSRVNDTVQRAIETGEGWEFEADLVTRDGTRRRVRSSAECLKDGNGEVELIIGVFTDITEDTRVYEELARSEQKYRILAEHATDIVLKYNVDGEITFVSPSCRVLGIDPQEAIGQSAIEFVIPEDRPRAMEAFARLLKHDPADGPFRSEHRAPKAGGGFIWLEASPTVIRDENGEPISVISSYRDVTDRREREIALAAATEAAEAATRAKAEFLSNMSHEIRTPLNGILGFAQLFARTDLDEDQTTYLERIRGAGRMLREIVDDILDFSKIEAGQLEIDERSFCMNELITETIDLVDAGRESKTVPIYSHIAPEADMRILADDTRIRQILTNLIGNAAKFTARGRIDVSVDVEASWLNISVSDTGIGISEDKLASVFDGFRQADTTITRRFGGTGLGLTISRSLARLMGGDLWLDSKEGKGTTVTFKLPYRRAPDATVEPHTSIKVSRDGQDCTIMVVDDVKTNLSLIELGLKDTGFKILTFTSAREAIEALEAGEKVDLILMDVQMPDLDGLSATKQIRAMDGPMARIPIMALTANAMPSQIAECRAAGMDDHFSKPIDLDKLEEKILEICGAETDASQSPSDEADDEMRALRDTYLDYLGTLGPELSQMAETLDEDDTANAIRTLAHSVAGTAGSFGFTDISDKAFELEEAALNNADPECESDRSLLEARLRAFLEAIRGAA